MLKITNASIYLKDDLGQWGKKKKAAVTICQHWVIQYLIWTRGSFAYWFMN